ncbi:hypothetical protein [Thermomonas sp.]|uniref:hypothetical protein n=1 Tax=Thermomonas sp. TaxID=1971895 RepID=UPI0039198E0F
MTALAARPIEVQEVRRIAGLCEAHLRYAAGCKDAGQAGPQLIHQQLARDYSRAAFAIVRRIAKRSQA